jgi:hypothetical protein
MGLTSWQDVAPPLSAAEIKQITGVQHSFRGTMFSLDPHAGETLQEHLQGR